MIPDSPPAPSASLLERLILYPFLLTTAYVLDTALSNQVEPAGFIRLLGVGLMATAVVLLASWGAARSRWIAGLVTAGTMLAIASRGLIVDGVAWLAGTLGANAVPLTVVSSGILLFVTLAVVIRLWRARPGRVLFRTTAALNVFCAVLLALVAIQGLGQVPRWVGQLARGPATSDPAIAALPDVFVILLDGYPRADSLAASYGIDNSRFLDALGERDFTVAPGSLSNYTYTELTLASMLSMEYLAVSDGTTRRPEAEIRTDFLAGVAESAGIRALREAGYRIAASAAGYEHVALRNAADIFMDRPELTDFESGLLLETWIPDLPGVSHDLLLSERRRRITGILADTAGMAGEDRAAPVFAIIHVPSPHIPLVFGSGGSDVPWGSRKYLAEVPAHLGMTTGEFQAAFAAQLDHLNSLVIDTVDSLLFESASPPVIILISDHGSSPQFWPRADRTVLLPNLLAVRTPDPPDTEADLPRVRTPVNLLRALLNDYAQGGDDLIADRFFVASVEEGWMVIEETVPPGD